MLNIPGEIMILTIRFYQRCLSPFIPARCRFYPTCSEYCCACFKRFSFFKALWYSTRRISKCHPFCEGGVDEVPS